MRLADFIVENVKPILMEWDAFARGITPGEKMDFNESIDQLLGNAIQHSPESALVELRLSGESTDVVLTVFNGGPPIPPGELPRIFDPLVRGSSAEHPKVNRPGV